MRLLLLYNPIAGAGRAADAARQLGADLKAAGHEADLGETSPTASAALDDAMRDADVVVVIGGDGAMRLMCGALVRCDTPVYHYPFGTENLFARAFGMDRTSARLLDTLESGDVERIDVGRVDDELFLLMVSVGYDAGVVRDLAARRGRRISHLSYVGPMLREFVRWVPPRLTIAIDGAAVVDDTPGMVVIANSAEYAARLDPAPEASMSDGLLDLVFMPVRSRADLALWFMACVRGTHLGHERVVFQRGRTMDVLVRPAAACQIDGDPGPAHEEGASQRSLRVAIEPASLSVLRPSRI